MSDSFHLSRVNIKRTSKCHDILKQSHAYGAVLVCGPPSTGKTEFARLISEQARDLKVYSFSLKNWNIEIHPTIESLFKLKFNGASLSQILLSEKQSGMIESWRQFGVD
jgi:hypothetical protein